MMIIDGLMFYVVGDGAFVDWTRKREDRLRTVWFWAYVKEVLQ
jgi:hypothetical protein